MSNHHKTISTYDQIAEKFSKSHWDSFWPKEMTEFIKLVPGNKILEIGCGAGRDAVFLNEFGMKVTGIDASAGMLAEARKRLPTNDFRQMDFRRLDFPNQTFDGFWSAASLLHLPKNEISGVLLEMKRILKPKGIGFISLKEKTNLDEGLIKEKSNDNLGRYFAFYTTEEFSNLLKQAGFNVIKSRKKLETDEKHTVWLTFLVSLN